VPDSTWFTNRHARRRLPPDELRRGAKTWRAPADAGALMVVATKPRGMTPGFVMQDAKGDRYLVKFDPPGYPDVPTGAEMVVTTILHALGWNVPENHLVWLDPARLVVDPRGGEGSARPAPTPEDLAAVLLRAGQSADGRLRVIASRLIAGTPKGGFRTLGRRPDDPNDTVPHQDRRELRGLRVVAAWLNYTDARRGNFFDSFVVDPHAPEGFGHLVHFVLDFSSALGAGNTNWKPARLGHEYWFDPPQALLRVVTLGLVRPRWEAVPFAHPALGYLDAETFDPVDWRTTYPNPLFDAATVRDSFWGAKLVTSLTEDDLRLVTQAGAWSDPRAGEVLTTILRGRQRKIARAYFDSRRINPIDGLEVDAATRLRFRDLAVEHQVVDGALARYRYRFPGSAWLPLADPLLPIGSASARVTVELQTSHDGGTRWSPTTRVELARDASGALSLAAIERATR
jgi:hypothetical protein